MEASRSEGSFKIPDKILWWLILIATIMKKSDET